jgi:GTP-binding protein
VPLPLLSEWGELQLEELTEMRPSGGGKTRLTFTAPSRGLIGYHGEFLSDTRGTGIMNRLFDRYGPHKGEIEGRQNGVLISMEQGEAVPYALNMLEERGTLFISPGENAEGARTSRSTRSSPSS